jgi:hypothetical protein
MEAATVSTTSGAVREAPARRTGPGAWLGIAFAVVLFAGFFIDDTPSSDASNAKWHDWYASSGHRAAMIVSAFLLAIAAVLLVSFLSTLWTRVAPVDERGARNPAPLALATLGAAGIATGGVVGAVVAGAMTFGDLPEPSPGILRFSDQIGYPILAVGGMLAVAAAIALLSVQAHRAGLFGRAMLVYGLIAAVGTALSFLFFPMLLTLIWFIAASVVLARR